MGYMYHDSAKKTFLANKKEREAKVYMEKVFEMIPEGIVIFDHQTKKIWATNAVFKRNILPEFDQGGLDTFKIIREDTKEDTASVSDSSEASDSLSL